MHDIKDKLNGASAADKVIGRGAAQLYAYAGIGSVYATLVSKGTREVFDEAGIEYTAQKTVPKIMNREKTGMCPVETISYESETIEELLEKIEGFLKRIGMI